MEIDPKKTYLTCENSIVGPFQPYTSKDGNRMLWCTNTNNVYYPDGQHLFLVTMDIKEEYQR